MLKEVFGLSTQKGPANNTTAKFLLNSSEAALIFYISNKSPLSQIFIVNCVEDKKMAFYIFFLRVEIL